MRKLSILLGLSGLMLLTGSALGQDKKAKPDAKSAPAKGDGVTVGEDGVRRDPKGIKGISEYQELIVKGDRAYVARDFDGAIAAYREAIQKDPQNALGHYRAGSAQLAKGDLKEAEAAWVSGLRFAGADGALKARLIFALADLRERQKNTDDAITRWKEYSANAEANKEAVTYPATAAERVARNEGWKKLAAESAEVKERIAKRLKEADEASRKSAADPKNK